ncbi:group III truncated hemoglobin [Altibacter lentus]|uniref:group III truncated hemoglobin n=1 Tax=Altibacter lentus TaxID=1223410 RepID=UPI00054D15BC|nr:group III truncated hemoglobin [Altibacter lentus]
MRTDITNREDISLLVRTFYGRVQKDALLGPVFNTTISNWESHFELLTDFWETNLFFKKSYKGNPITAHIKVDEAFHGGINEVHFGTWINLWHQTINDLFEGETAQIAKNRARNMATFIHLRMFEARKK